MELFFSVPCGFHISSGKCIVDVFVYVYLDTIYVQKQSEIDCLKKCKNIFKDINMNIPDNCLDGTHRIRKITEVRRVKKQSTIVRFISWRHRTEVYQARKRNENYRKYLDLNTDRFQTLNAAKDMVEGIDNVDFVFADVNCRLTVNCSY